MAGKPGKSGGARAGSGPKTKSYWEAVKAGAIILEVRAKQMHRDRPCFVYVIHETDNDKVCKIGISGNASRRFSHLQVGTWRELTLSTRFLFATEKEAFNVEALVHSSLVSLRRRGEWFDVDADRAASEIKKAVCSLGIKFLS